MHGPERASDGFHTIVIGAGSGGLTVAVGLARLGKRVALVERDAVGGDCTNVGCVPSKTLIDLAHRLATAPPSAEAPGRNERATGDERGRWALAEVRRRRDALRAEEERMLAELAGLELVRGSARLHRDGGGVPAVAVDDRDGRARVLRGRNVVLATGSSPARVDVPGLPADRTLTNASLFELTTPPEHLAIVGAGAIGCEMAFAFADLGSAVTLLDVAPRVLPRSEEGASVVVGRSLEREGIRVLTGAAATRFDPSSDVLHVTQGDTEHEVRGVTLVLMAIGRRPNVDALGLEEAGVSVARGAVVTDANHRTTAAGVFAIGDVTGRVDTTHAANAQGRRLVRRLVLPLPLVPEGDYPSVTFGRPEVAQVGPTQSALRARFPPGLLVTHRVELADTDRGVTLGLADGYVSVTAMRLTGRVLAATVVAPHAGEMVHLLTQAQRGRTSLWRLSRLVIAYPSLAEALRRIADAFVFESLPSLHVELLTYLRLRWRSSSSA